MNPEVKTLKDRILEEIDNNLEFVLAGDGGYDVLNKTAAANAIEELFLRENMNNAIGFAKWRDNVDGSYGYSLGRELTEEELYIFYSENKFPEK